MKKYLFLLSAIFLLLYIFPLGARPLVMPDETRYAEIAREMTASGDWIVMRLDGVLHFEKPAMGYWLNAISMLTFGRNNFAVRLPSALSTGITALLLFFVMLKLGGGSRAGFFAALAFLISPISFGIGTYNNLDAIITMFVTGALVFLFLSHSERDLKKRVLYLVLSGFFMGGGFLTKGLVALVIPAISIVPFLIWERRLREFILLSWLPLVVALVIVLPWAVVVHLRESDFWSYFIWAAHFERFVSSEAPHSNPFFYYVPALLLGALPLTFLLPASVSGLREVRLKDPLVRFAVCWFVFPFIFFSASQGKIITYLLPFYPPFVILVTVGLTRYLEGGGRRAFSTGTVSLAAFVVLLAALFTLNRVITYQDYTLYGDGETWKLLFVIAALILWAILCTISLKKADVHKKLTLFLIAPVLFLFSTHFSMPDFFNERKAMGEFLDSYSHEIKPDTEIVTYGHPVSAICWYYERDDVKQIISIPEEPFGLRYGDPKDRLLTRRQLNELVEEKGGKGGIVVIMKAKDYRDFSKYIPEAGSVDWNGSFVFIRF
jgi:4-amino-4-deoxy-L-arabinose transferase